MSEYQHIGIGQKLVKMVSENYKDYLRIVLIAYDKEIGFYKHCGFEVGEEKTPMFNITLDLINRIVMQQRDYLLREIEKIGEIINALLQKLFGGEGNLPITLEKQVEDAKGMLLNEMNFDFDKFLSLGIEDSNKYICSFEGFNIENIELLAELTSEIGFNDKCNNSKKYLEKALQLYELCNSKSKTYSLERETNINAIKDALL